MLAIRHFQRDVAESFQVCGYHFYTDGYDKIGIKSGHYFTVIQLDLVQRANILNEGIIGKIDF